MCRRKWTEEEILSLEEWVMGGIGETEIARRLGRTRKSVEGRKKRLELRRPMIRTMEVERLLRLGHTPKQVSDTLGVTIEHVRNVKCALKKMDISTKGGER